MTEQTVWHAPEEAPPVDAGGMREFVVAVRRARSGKVYSFAASYLNGYGLEYQDGCPHPDECPGEDHCQDGCATTGWFDLVGDDCYDSMFRALNLRDGDKFMGWCELPQWSSDGVSEDK